MQGGTVRVRVRVRVAPGRFLTPIRLSARVMLNGTICVVFVQLRLVFLLGLTFGSRLTLMLGLELRLQLRCRLGLALGLGSGRQEWVN